MQENIVVEKNKSTQYVETVKANSFCGRYGGVGTDFKIYFDTVQELKQGIANVLEGAALLNSSLLQGVNQND